MPSDYWRISLSWVTLYKDMYYHKYACQWHIWLHVIFPGQFTYFGNQVLWEHVLVSKHYFTKQLIKYTIYNFPLFGNHRFCFNYKNILNLSQYFCFVETFQRINKQDAIYKQMLIQKKMTKKEIFGICCTSFNTFLKWYTLQNLINSESDHHTLWL